MLFLPRRDLLTQQLIFPSDFESSLKLQIIVPLILLIFHTCIVSENSISLDYVCFQGGERQGNITRVKAPKKCLWAKIFLISFRRLNISNITQKVLAKILRQAEKLTLQTEKLQ